MEYQQDRLTREVIAGIIKVHPSLGPGFLENIYRHALFKELSSRGLEVDKETEIFVYYMGEEVGKHRLDILVERTLIVELKTVEQLEKIHYAQVRSYLKATGLRTAILVNFAREKADYRRIDNFTPTSPSSPDISLSPFLHSEDDKP